ncbi:MAG TPA: TMEM175 family protein [Solirubrobacteraceae bacterium]
MGINRLEAFSDGVIAVAVTLLVLDIKVPAQGGDGSLLDELARAWPHYAAYVVSFMTIGIIWINHHAMIGRLAQADHSILILNLLLLMSIVLLPFATELMAAYLRASSGESLAAGLYSGAFLLMSVLFAALNRHILIERAHMLRAELPLEARRRVLSRSIAGLIPYLLATALAAVSPYLTLVICAAVAVFYALPVASGGGQAA